MGGFVSGATPSFFPNQGGSGTVINNYATVTAGQTFTTQQEIYDLILNAQLAAQRAGTATSLTNGGR
jgi:hypothetical protein